MTILLKRKSLFVFYSRQVVWVEGPEVADESGHLVTVLLLVSGVFSAGDGLWEGGAALEQEDQQHWPRQGNIQQGASGSDLKAK